jgi:hypothetical protein
MTLKIPFKFLMLCAIVLAFNIVAKAQLSVDNVYSVQLNNSGAIRSGEEIKGYYLFYQTDKVDRKTYGYTLQILDENLNKIKDISFQDEKGVALKEASFNGNTLMFVFFNKDAKTLEYRTFGIDGVQKVSYTRDLDKKTIRFLEQKNSYLDEEETQDKTLFSVENKGFIANIPLRTDGEYTFDVNFYGGDKRQQWTYTPDEDAKFSTASYLGSTDSVAVFQVTKKESMFGSKITSRILGLYLDNGKKAFDYETTKDQYTFYPMNLGKLNGTKNFLIIGPYFTGGDNIMKDKSLGLGVWTMNNQGQVSTTKYNSWEKDFSKFLSVGAGGKVDDLGYIYFHRILQTSDGKIFAIGEGYK